MKSSTATLETGSRFEGRYEILEPLGAGNFGRVYRARQLATGKSVALKLLAPREGAASSSGSEAERFERETRIGATLSHTNIVELIDKGQTPDGQLYAVFVYIDGETLEQALAREGRLEVREALRLMTQVAEALSCAHAGGIVHRDLKPSNLMLSGSGARRNALVLDFGLGGLAEDRRRKAWRKLTQSGTFVGTPLYASPEQLFGEPATPRSDLYAWGLVFLECLTGRHPLAEGDPLARDVVEIPEWLQSHPLGDVLQRVTARDAAKRDASVDALIETLDEIARGELPVAPEAPGRRTPPPLAEQGERRHLTVMFCDLVGSSALSQRLDAETYRKLVRAYQSTGAEAVERHGGQVVQYLGDGLLVYFGHPHAHEDDAARAVRAGREILRGLAALGPRIEAEHGVALSARVGIHTGPVVIGEMGSGAKKETLALGDAPNIAARLEAFAEPDSVVISDATLRLVPGLFVTEDLGTPELKGISEPVRAYRVLASSGVESRLDRAPRLTPFVGREQELGLLVDRFEEAQDGRGGAVLISGEAGIGKSRLLRELRERLRASPHSWLECSSSPYTQQTALFPVIDLIERALDFRSLDASEARIERLERGLAYVGLDPAEAVPLFASLLSLRLPERYPPLEISPQMQRQKTLAVLLGWLLALAEKQPAVLVVEDLHWADPSTLEWLGLLIEQCPTARLLLLLTFRPELEPPWAGSARLPHVLLDRLKRRDSRRLVLEASPGAALPDSLVDRIASRSDGVPLFVEELSRGVAEARDPEASGEQMIPETIHDLLVARLDRLGAAKQVAQLAAAVGREFPYALLEAVAPMAQPALQEGLGGLVEAELLYQRGLLPDATYTFKHALVQDAAYQSLLESQRRELHGRIADVLIERMPTIAEQQPEVIARHCEEAGRSERAIDYYQRAGERAVQQIAYAEAVAHFQRAMGLLQALPESTERDRQELSLLTGLGDALAPTLSSPEIERLYLRARHLSDALGDATELFRSLDGLAALHWGRAEWDGARELENELLAMARGTGDPAQLLVAHWNVANGSYHRGDLGRAREHADAAIAIYEPEDYRDRHYPYNRADAGILSLGAKSWTLWQLGHPDEALAVSREALALARDLEDPFHETIILGFALVLHLLRREYRIALEEAELQSALAQEYGFLFHVVSSRSHRAQALAHLGQLDEGIAEMRDSLEVMRSAGIEWGVSWKLAVMAQALGRKGKADEGLDLLAEMRSFVARGGERVFEADAHRIHGELLLALSTPDPGRAEAAFHDALTVARAQGSVAFELRAATRLGTLLRDQGRRDEARALLQPVYDRFTEGFETADLKDAKALLEEL